MQKDNLIIIAGMPRAGTSYLYQELAKHPNIYIPIIKETNYFTRNNRKDEVWFEALYQEAQDTDAMFDISPLYFFDDYFFDKIKAFHAKPKVILVLRDPNDWVKSLYKQVKKQRYGMKGFENFLDGYSFKFEHNVYDVNFKTFNYKEKVERFVKEFRDSLLLLDFGELQRNQVETLKQIETFIEVPAFFSKKNVCLNKVNAGDVRSSKLITYLSTFSILRDLAFKILPEPVIHYIRNRYILGVPLRKQHVDLIDPYKDKHMFKDFFR